MSDGAERKTRTKILAGIPGRSGGPSVTTPAANDSVHEALARVCPIKLDMADTLSDTRFRDHPQCSEDGIAVPMPCVSTTRPLTDTVELTGNGLKNRGQVPRGDAHGIFVPDPSRVLGVFSLPTPTRQHDVHARGVVVHP